MPLQPTAADVIIHDYPVPILSNHNVKTKVHAC